MFSVTRSRLTFDQLMTTFFLISSPNQGGGGCTNHPNSVLSAMHISHRKSGYDLSNTNICKLYCNQSCLDVIDAYQLMWPFHEFGI